MQTSQSEIEWPANHIDAAIDALANAHYAVIPNFLSVNMQKALLRELKDYQEKGFFHQAGIGRGSKHGRNAQIRGDSMCWLEEGFAIGQQYLQRMSDIRQQLNQALFLGLQSFEGHYAHYQVGSCYQRHVDRHQDNDARVVSSVCYLNDDWPQDAGGELHLFNANNELLLALPPTGGTLVLFMSADMPHEVLVANRARYSIAGWFRRDE